jgi:hypothetical protein
VRIPTFSRHSSTDTADDDRPTMVTGSPAAQRADRPPGDTPTVTRPSEAGTTRWSDNNRGDETADLGRADANRGAADRAATERAAAAARAERETMNPNADTRAAQRGTTDMRESGRHTGDMRAVDWPDADRRDTGITDRAPVAAGPKPRASLLATLGLIGGVAAALLVLSGPLLPYGIGLAVLALILSVSGMHATGRRHVAGKTDALIGMVLSLAAIVVGVLALTGSLPWLGTNMQPVTDLRQWLDTQTVNRF